MGLTYLLSLGVQHVPAAVRWIAGLLAKAFVSEKVKSLLKDKAKLRAYRSAVQRALTEFSTAHPSMAASLFDQHFIETSVADEVAKLLTRHQEPDVAAISQAYAAQFPKAASNTSAISEEVKHFLALTESELKSEAALQEYLTHRQTDESVRILRRLQERSELEAIPRPTACASSALDAQSVEDSFTLASTELLSWPQVLGSNIWIDRPELQQLLDRIDSNSESCSLLLGGPGSGKSALLARLGTECARRGWAVLAIKADQLPEELASNEGLQAMLSLPASTSACLRTVAEKRKTLLLVDQLDALSELVDLKTQRLKILLRLISEARAIPGVHVVASCRIFDRNYDRRLSTIEAEELTLDLPDWNVVEGILSSKGIDSSSWPTSFREILRVPQCLKLFLAHFSAPTERAVFESYQLMLEELWTGRLFGPSSPPGAMELTNDIATEMAEREVMFVPSARYDERRMDVDYLVASGVLQYDHTRRQLSFTHQTLFDFARARAFVTRQDSLTRYVLERQTGLFVRPKLWTALHYLRGADPSAYTKELLSLWNTADLRPHLRMLLIEFIGLQEEPSSSEVSTLKPVFFDARYAPTAFSAIAGRSAWFEVVAGNALPAAMQASSELSWSAVRVLSSAWEFAPERVLQFLSSRWLGDTSKTSQILQCLRAIRSWNAQQVDLACTVIRAHEVGIHYADDLASLVSASAPDLALRLVGEQIKKAVAKALASRPDPVAVNEDADVAQHMAAHIRRENEDGLRKILASPSDWYQLPAVAEAAPQAFLDEVWPSLRLIVEAIASEHRTGVARYQDDHLSATKLEVDDERQGREFPLLESAVFVVRAVAKSSPDLFWRFVDSQLESESMTVHRLLALGMVECAASTPERVLSYLIGDVRRLSLENYSEDERETKRLIRAVWPALNPHERSSLENFIRAADIYSGAVEGKPAENRQRALLLNRQFRLRLLLQLPREELSPPTAELVTTELRRFPDFRDERRDFELISSRSPMSAETMATANVATIESFLAAHPDSTEWGDGFRRRSGSIEVSREFAAFAKSNLSSALAVLERLDPATQQRPAAYAIREFSADEPSNSALYQLILKLDDRGFNGDEFRGCCADALLERAKSPEGLPDEIIAMLEKWLRDAQLDAEDIESSAQNDQEADRHESFLWGMRGFRVLPHGTFPIVNALFFGLLLRNSVPSERILTALNEHLRRGGRFAIWDALAGGTLQHLRHCDKVEAARFLSDLFVAHPKLLQTHSGALLVAHCLSWCPPATTKEWMLQILKGSSRKRSQIYGELLGLRSVLLPDDSDCISEIEGLISHASRPSEHAEKIVGLTYAAANLWRDAQRRDLISRILCSAMDSTDEAIAAAALDWFRVIGDVTWDDVSRPVIEAFANGRSLDATKARSYVLDRISDVIDDAPQLVHRVARRLLGIFKGEVGDLSTSSALESETLLTVALTLQRLEEPHRTNGLELFEELLHFNAYKARDVLMDIDRRPGAATPATQLRRRRRRKQPAKQ